MTKRYGVPAFSFVTFLPLIVSAIVKPGPTVPLTVFAEAAAELLPVAASAAAATATVPRSRYRIGAIVLISCASFKSRASDRARIGRPDPRRPERYSHRGDPPDFPDIARPSAGAFAQRRTPNSVAAIVLAVVIVDSVAASLGV